MNKILKYTRYLTFIITCLLTIIFGIRNEIFDTKIILLYISLIILLIINIRDIKLKINFSNRYNILYIIVMIITSVILFRSLFDTNIISNSKYYAEIINSIRDTSSLILDYGEFGDALYLSHNVYYLLILYLCLIIYHIIELKGLYVSKYSTSSLICLFTNIILMMESIILLSEKFDINHFPLLFFAANLILLVVEIASLKVFHKYKRDWPIYISFLLNLFVFIAIFT